MIIIATLILQMNIFAANKVLKIMPLGDSITAIGIWRPTLLKNLTDNGYNVEFVGSQKDTTYHEGHGGMGCINLGNSTDLTKWLSSTNPDIVLMHLGTNDCWGSNRMTKEILAAYTTLIGQMRVNNTNMIIMVAKILPMYPTGGGEVANNNVIDLNSSIDNWAKGLQNEKSPIIVVDQYIGFDTKTDTYDGVHENDIGSIKMATKWYNALVDVLSPKVTNTPVVSEYKIGDINKDNKITSTDASLVERHILGVSTLSGEQFTLADCNKDLKLTSSDVALIGRYVIGLITSL